MEYAAALVTLADTETENVIVDIDATLHTFAVTDTGSVLVEANIGNQTSAITVGTFTAGVHNVTLTGVLSFDLTSTGATVTGITGA